MTQYVTLSQLTRNWTFDNKCVVCLRFQCPGPVSTVQPVLLSIILHNNSTENPKIRQFSFYLQLWAKVNVSPGCRVRLIQSNGQKIIWGPRGRGLCKLLPCSPTSLFISNPKLENITKNITAYSNKWLHSGNNGSAGPDSVNNGQRIKYKNPVTSDGALFVDYCHDGSSSLVAGPGSSLHEQ